LPPAVTVSRNYYLVAGVGQAVRGAVAQDRIAEDSQPFIHSAVTGDYQAESVMAGDD